MRKGITLLEALFAIFVAAIGIMSLASLLPVGKYQIKQAENADRGSAIGLSSINSFLDHRYIHYVAGENKVDLNGDGILSPTYTDVVVIDPWFLSREPTATTIPYDSSATSSNYLDGDIPPRLLRLTCFPTLTGTPLVHRRMADAVFASQDDVIFTTPDRPEARTQMVFTGDGTVPYDGDYTWLATVAPHPAERFFSADRKTRFRVTVATFQKRAASLPGAQEVPHERIIRCDLIGGGDVRFHCPLAGSTAKFLKMRINQWVMLAWCEALGVATDPAGNTLPDIGTAAGTGKNRGVICWYRIQALAEPDADSTTRFRYATLDGPTWNAGNGANFDTDSDGLPDVVYDLDTSTAGITLHAYVFTDCIDVREREIFYNSEGWAQQQRH